MTTSNKLYKKELAEFREIVIDMISTTFKEDGVVDPVLFAFSIKDSKFELAVLSGLGELLVNPETKDSARQTLIEFAAERKPIAIALACEARARSISKEDYNKEDISNIDLSKIEPEDVLMITFETYDMQSSIMWKVDISNKNRMTMLVELDNEWEEKQKGHGIFNDILQEDYSEIAEEIRKMMNN